jgi:hypothetical protein
MFSDPRKDDLISRQGFPPLWLGHIQLLLALPDDLHRHALVIMSRNLDWFYAIDPEWTEAHLLPAFESNDSDDRDAVWSGFLGGAKVPNRQLYLRLKNNMLAFVTNSLPSRRSYGESITGMLLAGWGSIDAETGERFISNAEMRSLLLHADDEFRSRVLWQAKRWANERSGSSDERWANKLPDLLRLWPRQISARSPNTSARLCELAFASADQFPIVAEFVLPLLTRIERDYLILPELGRSGENVVDRHPRQALALLYAVLPDNALTWPYGIESTLERIGEADNTLRADERLIALKRRWDSR